MQERRGSGVHRVHLKYGMGSTLPFTLSCTTMIMSLTDIDLSLWILSQDKILIR